MRSLSGCDEPFRLGEDTLFPGAETIASLLILFSIFLMPTLLYVCGMGKSDVIIFHQLPALAALGFFHWDKVPFRRMTWREAGEVLVFFLIILLVNVCVTIPWLRLLRYFGIETEEKQAVLKMLRGIGGLYRWYAFFSVCVLTPLIEELLFRRIIYGALLRFGRVTAVTLTAILFSVAHLYWRGIPGLIVLGLGFQLVYLRQKNLTAAVFLHGLNNSLTFLSAV